MGGRVGKDGETATLFQQVNDVIKTDASCMFITWQYCLSENPYEIKLTSEESSVKAGTWAF